MAQLCVDGDHCMMGSVDLILRGHRKHGAKEDFFKNGR